MEQELLVAGSEITKTWLQDRIKAVHKFRPCVRKVEPLGPEAVGYASLIRRVHLEWDCSKTNLPDSVIVKIPNMSKGQDAFEKSSGTKASEEDMDLFQRTSHEIESKFYCFTQKVNPKPLLLPKIYAAEDFSSKSPVIVMEDYKNCCLVDFIEGFSESQLFAIAEQVAFVQVYSIKNKQIYEALPTIAMAQLMRKFSANLKFVCENLVAAIPELHCIRTLLANTLEKDPEWMFNIVDEYNTQGRISVLVHGDLWAPQILWQDKVTIAAIIDWQMAHRGSPVEDMLRVLSTSTSVDNRRQLLSSLLDHYYSSMGKELGVDNMPFSRKYLDEELIHFAPYSCLFTVFATGMWLNSDILKVGGNLDERRAELIHRCKCFVEDVIQLCRW